MTFSFSDGFVWNLLFKIYQTILGIIKTVYEHVWLWNHRNYA